MLQYYTNISCSMICELSCRRRLWSRKRNCEWRPMAKIRSRSCGICGGQSGAGAGFLRVLRLPLPIFILPISPQSPSPIIWGWYNRPVVAAVPKVSQRKLKKKTHSGDFPNTGCWYRKRQIVWGMKTDNHATNQAPPPAPPLSYTTFLLPVRSCVWVCMHYGEARLWGLSVTVSSSYHKLLGRG
jgi:hypothetical protein